MGFIFGLTLMKNLLPQLSKILLGSIATTSATGAEIHKSSNLEILILVTSNFVRIVKSLEDSALLLQGIPKTTENKTKEKRGGIHGMLLGTLRNSILGNMLGGKVII